MENYFSFNEKALAVVGINLEKPGRFDKPLKVVALTVLSIATFQNFMYAALSDGVSFDLANAVTLTLYGTMGVAKLLTAFLHQKELGRIKKKFGKLVEDLDDNEKTRYGRELNLYRRITKVFVITGLSNTSMFNIMPVAIYISSFLQQGVAIKVFSYALWYPFDKQEYFIVVYLWECFCSCYWCTVFLIVDGLVILLIGQAVVLFKNVGETMSQIIDDFEASPKESSKKLKLVIEYHSILLDLAASLIRVYEAPLLVNVLVQTGCIGMVTFIVSVSAFTMDYRNLKFEEISDSRCGVASISGSFELFKPNFSCLLGWWENQGKREY